MRGFIDPALENLPQPLWHLDIPYQRWSMRSTKQIGHNTGFYDYAGTAPELDSLQSAGDAFRELENDFPRIRGTLLSKHFRNWHKHLGFLLRYMQMIRARSLLFFAQKEDEGKALQAWTVKDVHPDGKTLTLTSMEPVPPPAPFIKNRTKRKCARKFRRGDRGCWISIGPCGIAIPSLSHLLRAKPRSLQKARQPRYPQRYNIRKRFCSSLYAGKRASSEACNASIWEQPNLARRT
jgi:hypothetical protein